MILHYTNSQSTPDKFRLLYIVVFSIKACRNIESIDPA